ncbi:hypothetical protein IGV50_004423 [Salmonella enterica subsp. enterica serovar Newport]|nr:hypothetical protein [Salmonella enterica subsp. enterica serovar Newport]
MNMKLNKNRDTSKAEAAIVEIKPARLQLNIHPTLHEQFRKISFNNDEKMSDLITEFVINYVRRNGVDIDQKTETMYMKKPSEWE